MHRDVLIACTQKCCVVRSLITLLYSLPCQWLLADFLNELIIMTSFAMGSCFTGWLIGKEKLTLGQSYGRLMCCTGTVVFIAMCSGNYYIAALNYFSSYNM